ncbi:MAG: hypothetical protein M3N34_07100 [Pseudomonadota bacterium]|nr:hypothetical protein [Pseudomonadota bacterium]
MPDQVHAAFAAAGEQADIVLLDGMQMAGAIGDLVASERRLVIAGGDGTISCAASVLAGTDTELAILPLGTLNHFARDSGIPADLTAAAAVAVRGRATKVDTVTVGDRVCINNASLGIYPVLVRSRDTLQKDGLSKRVSALPAAWAALTKAHDLHLELDTGQGPRPLVTPLLFIGNNTYSLDGGSVGKRASLDAGELCVLAVRHRPRLALAWFALRTIVGKSSPAQDFAVIDSCATIRLSAVQTNIQVAIDGEVKQMPLPLEFTIQPRSLNLVVDPA